MKIRRDLRPLIERLKQQAAVVAARLTAYWEPYRLHVLNVVLIGATLLVIFAVQAAAPQPQAQTTIVALVPTPTTVVATPTLVPLPPSTHEESHLTVNHSLSPTWPDTIQRWGDLITSVSQAYAVDADLLAAIMLSESRGDPDARSYAGAIGLMGVMPLETSSAALYDPATNLAAGADILTRYLVEANGDLHAALAVYNAGWGNYQVVEAIMYAAQVLHDYGSAVAQQSDEAVVASGLWSVGVEVYADFDSAEPVLVSRHIEWSQSRYSSTLVFDGSRATSKPMIVIGYAIPVIMADTN